MTDFLLELLSEEIPARMQARARNDLALLFAEELDKAGLSHGAIDAFSTPRRLVLIARELAAETQAVREEIKGPRSSAPPQALEGFLRKTGLSQDQLEERDGVYFAVVERPGRAAGAVIQDALTRIFADFPWPKSMRWGEASAGEGALRWVRPLQGIVAILGEEIVPFEIAGVSSGAMTFGHRFHHPGPITVNGASDYVEKLRACHVIVDHEERERIIREGAQAVAEAAGLKLLCDEGLVVENAGLTEWPVPLLGRFDPEFLDVPREVIVLTMRTNQKYFACLGEDSALAPAFVCTANIDASDGGVAIVEGNRRVLAARLSDARFFWEQDLKVSLEEQAKKLSQIVFHEKLGTVADKVERVAKLAEWLASEGIVPGCDPKLACRAAELAKADLVTGMVGEFPEVQGIIGGYLARAQGETNAVADAVRDHYKPVGQGDEVPTAPVTVAVALGDKLDSIVGFFAIGAAPTGSRDPFALRRAALGIIELILRNNLRLELDHVAFRAAGHFIDQWVRPGFSQSEVDDVTARFSVDFYAAVPRFFVDRLKVQQREMGVRHDIIDAVYSLETRRDDIVLNLARVKALQVFIETDEGRDLHAGYKRASNILKKEDWRGSEGEIARTGEEDPLVGVDDPDLAEVIAAKMNERHEREAHADVAPQEAALIAALDSAEPEAAAAVEREDFTGAMGSLAKLRAPIDAFFDHVTVNDPDPAVRERRLNLLLRFRDAVHRVADFSKIEG